MTLAHPKGSEPVTSAFGDIGLVLAAALISAVTTTFF
jgi:hypothetical protein